jgi:hypothetical protein
MTVALRADRLGTLELLFGRKQATGVHRNSLLEATMFTIVRFPGSIRDI